MTHKLKLPLSAVWEAIHNFYKKWPSDSNHYDAVNSPLDTEAKPFSFLDQQYFPNWAKNAVLYEVNIRQFTPEGNFSAFADHLPRIKALGVDILWFMPVHPIGLQKRKGALGSPYAVADYRAVHPDYGTMPEFKMLVKQAHDLGFKVIIDWVANHTSWDHQWITDHPEYYRQEDGQIIDPINPETDAPWGWEDVAELDFNHPATGNAMIQELEFWVDEIGVDGFRFDVAHQVPLSFWEKASSVLYQKKELFLLAESEMPEHINTGSFLANYAWEYLHLMNEIAKGKENLKVIDQYFSKDKQKIKNGFHIYFTSNHDENAWSGSVFERLGEGHLTFAALAATVDGMPLIYGGQEAPIRKRLNFYEQDPIEWDDYAYADFYQKLFALKHRNQALWNGHFGGPLVRLSTGSDEQVFAFTRAKDKDRVVVVANLSGEIKEISLANKNITGNYQELFSEVKIHLGASTSFELKPWEYLILEKET